MSKYYVTGGLAGPWKKKKVDNLEPVYIDFEITEGDSPTVTTEATFAEVCDLVNKGRTVIAKARLDTLEFRIPLGAINRTEGEITAIAFAGFMNVDNTRRGITIAMSALGNTVILDELASA